MKTTNIVFVDGAHKNYPQWDMIGSNLTEKFKDFHIDLRSQGYEIKACNIAVKNNEVFWILLDDGGWWYRLEHYANLIG